MTQLSILEATKFCGKDRKTLYRAIKQGKLSATTAISGALQIETSELIRVYGESVAKSVALDSGESVALPQIETPNEALLRQENQSLKERLADKERHIEDLREAMARLGYSKSQKKAWWKF
jgi:hypothetical protein